MLRPLVWLVLRLRLLVLAGWIAAALASAVYLPGLSGAEEAELGGLVPTDAKAVGVERRSLELFRVPLLSRTVVVQRDERGLSTEAQRRVLERAAAIRTEDDPALRTVVFALPVLNTGRLVPGASENGTTAVTYLFFRPGSSIAAHDALGQSYAERIRADGDPVTGVTGAAPARIAQWEAIEGALPWVEAFTVLLIALVVGVTFRSIGAPLVALGAAGIGYVVAVGVVGWAGRALDLAVPREVEPVMLVLLLGVVTDYAVFLLSGTKRRLAEGRGRLEAAEAAAQANVPIIVTTGLIVAFGTATLLVGRLDFFRAFGPGAALTVLVALAVSVTFVPAALATFGRLVFWPSLERRSLDEGDEPVAPADPRQGRVLGLLRYRALALVVAAVALAGLAFGAIQLRDTKLGFTLLTGLPGNHEVEQSLFAAGKGFAPGIVAPTEVLLEGEGVGDRRDALAELQERLAAQPGVAGVLGPASVPEGVEQDVLSVEAAARYALVLDSDPLGGQAVETVEALEEALPALLRESGLGDARAGLAGDSALAAETIASIRADILRIALAAIGVNLLFLALYLRSLVAPVYLVAASALGLAAALGLTAAVFSWLGYGDLTYYVPFAAAVLLLSLGSDYNLFVVGHVWRAGQDRSLREAVAIAAPRTSRAIAIAGIALAGSFALLALVPLRPFREFAFAMSAGILIDTFLVRTLLVPALIALVGERSRWPGRRPRVPAAQTGGVKGP